VAHDEIAAALSEPALRARFLSVFAGQRLRFPKTHGGAPAEVVRVLGVDAAERLRWHFAGRTLYVPIGAAAERARRDLTIRARLAAGESPAAIARSWRGVYRLSEAAVRRIAARLGAE
jgi:hypothetical protein